MAPPDEPSDLEPESIDAEAASAGEGGMTFLDHLEELRWTLIKSAIAFIIGCVISGVFLQETLGILRWPLDYGLREADSSIVEVVTNTPMGAFTVVMVVCFIGGTVLSLPFILFFIGQFVAPALTDKEKHLILPACIAGLVLFVAGSVFSFFLLVTSVIKVAVYANTITGTKLLLPLDRYYVMMAWLVLGLGVAFQFPLVIQILVYLGLVNVATLRKWRRVMIVVCFVVAAAITPTPDPLNMFIVAAPLIVLYELAIWVAAVYTVPKLEASRREAGLDD